MERRKLFLKIMNLCDYGIDLPRYTKSIATEAKIDKLDFIKIKKLCSEVYSQDSEKSKPKCGRTYLQIIYNLNLIMRKYTTNPNKHFMYASLNSPTKI